MTFQLVKKNSKRPILSVPPLSLQQKGLKILRETIRGLVAMEQKKNKKKYTNLGQNLKCAHFLHICVFERVLAYNFIIKL